MKKYERIFWVMLVCVFALSSFALSNEKSIKQPDDTATHLTESLIHFSKPLSELQPLSIGIRELVDDGATQIDAGESIDYNEILLDLYDGKCRASEGVKYRKNFYVTITDKNNKPHDFSIEIRYDYSLVRSNTSVKELAQAIHLFNIECQQIFESIKLEEYKNSLVDIYSAIRGFVDSKENKKVFSDFIFYISAIGSNCEDCEIRDIPTMDNPLVFEIGRPEEASNKLRELELQYEKESFIIG